MEKKSIGIIGGMGPMATVELFRLIVANTKSSADQDHIHIYIDNNTQISDRTQAILHGGKSPVPEIVASAEKLEQAGADLLLMPCNTSHYFIDEIQRQVSLKIHNMIEETAAAVYKAGYKKAGLLATTGTVKGRIYEKYSEKYGIEILSPDFEEQEILMRFIYEGVKAGNTGFDVRGINKVVDSLTKRGAETIILGCTELPVGKKMYGLDFESIDALETLARSAVVEAGYELI